MSDLIREPWYSNKDLFEMQLRTQEQMGELHAELQRTTEIVRKYNGLREEVGQLRGELSDLRTEALVRREHDRGRHSVAAFVYSWGGWVIALAATVAFLKEAFF